MGISKSTWEKAAAFSNNDDARAAGTKEGEGPRLGRRGTRGRDWRSKRHPAGVRTQPQMQWKTSGNQVKSGSAGIQDENQKGLGATGRRTDSLQSGFLLQVVSCKWSPFRNAMPGMGVMAWLHYQPRGLSSINLSLSPKSKVQVPGVKNVGGAGRSRVSSVADRK